MLEPAVLLMVALGLLVYVTMPSAGAEGEVRVELESDTFFLSETRVH